jgi:small GTP-binding protein
MVMINHATREITIKVVYYGPGLCGKTTNLEYIYKSATPEKKGKLLTVATETDRTLFFDFLPMELGTVKGMRLRTQLYTVPGQVFYDATRRIVLRGADGVVFVADSQRAMLDANLESVENLKTNLEINNLDPNSIPLVFQFNKRDLPDLAEPEEMNKILNYRNVPFFNAVAVKGTGVNETLRKIIELVIINLHQKDAMLKGSKPAAPKAEAASQMKDKEETAPLPNPIESKPQKVEIKEEEPEVQELEVIPDEEINGKSQDEPLPIEEEISSKEEENPSQENSNNKSNSKVDDVYKKISDLQEKLYSLLNELDEIKQKISELKNK